MAEPRDLILPLLREMREENLALHAKTQKRLLAIEKNQVSFKQALAADSLLTRLVTGDFEQRIERLEEWLAKSRGGA